MSGLNTINYILQQIVKGGKTILQDRKIEREKVPTFVNQRVQCINMQSVIHDGYQHQPLKKFSYFSVTKDNQPKNINKDGGGPNKLKIQKQKIVNAKTSSPSKNRYNQRSFSYSGFKERRLKSGGFITARLEHGQKQKENCFVQLPEDDKNRKVIKRLKLREQMEDDKLRAQKQRQNLKQYEQKLANEIFQKQRTQRKSTKEKLMNQHVKKGKDHSFYFNGQGQAILFKHTKVNLDEKSMQSTRQNRFKFDNQEKNMVQYANLNPFFVKNNFKSTKNVNDYNTLLENQRIRSAKGEAFASAVLKTVNLSRISMNQSLRQLQVQEFMKRNDLFNNNHTRQTTSIPYLQTKPGTVYTELSTNQVVGNDISEKLSQSRKSSEYYSKTYSRKRSHFQHLGKNQLNSKNKTQRLFDRFQQNNELDSQKIQPRSIKTAQQYIRRDSLSERRPRSSINKEKITTVNEQLVIALIQ